jgi:hypothetical protein
MVCARIEKGEGLFPLTPSYAFASRSEIEAEADRDAVV